MLQMYIDEEGNHVLYGDGAFNGKHGFLYKVHLDSDGCICNANGEKIMTPVQ